MYFNSARTVERQQLQAITDILRHRGPDDEGYYIDQQIGLGHRRLSILDLSPAGHQPMSNIAQSLWLVFNGEIYNYLELREELQALGCCFQSQTDTEVILHAYATWGTECLNKFNGMWAFALWDKKKQTLFCARDRFGIKPFYYFLDAEKFIFASELKALLQHPEIPVHVDDESVYYFLNYGWTHVGQRSFIKDIHQVEPAHFMLIKDQPTTQRSYWEVGQEQSERLSHETPALTFRRLLTDSIQLRLRSDVPIGTCLSGGLDSSSIVCLARQIISKHPEYHYQQETFSSCFEDSRFDERKYIEYVLKQTGARKNYLFPTPQMFLDNVEELVYLQDEPMGSLSMFAQWCVMKTVGESGITVLLDGQGSDEMMAGYGHDSFFWADLLYSGQWGALVPEIQASLKKYPLRTFKRMGRMILPQMARNWEWRRRSLAFLSEDFQQTHHLSDAFPWRNKYSGNLKNECFKMLSYSLVPLLRYEDRSAMHFSIESRLPFLDYRLVNFIFSLPNTQIIHQGWSKWILRQAMDGILPQEIQWRSDKMGFVTPQNIWFKNELVAFIKAIFSDPRFHSRPYWNGKEVEKTYAHYLNGKHSTIESWIWRLINLELWLQRYIDTR